MPIHDQGYQRYGGERSAHGRAWWVIARTQLLAAIRQRKFLALLAVSWLPFVARAVQIYFSSTFAQASILAPGPQMFRDVLDQQSFFVFILTLTLGGALADDRRANALPLYLSRPLTRVEYVAGRLMPVLLCVLGVTWLPAILLLVVQVALSGSLAFLREHLFLIPAITLVSLVQALLASFAILALASLSRNRRFVAIMYAGTVFFTAGLYRGLRGVTGSRAWAVLSPTDMIDVLADAVFRVGAPPPVPVAVAVLVIGLLIAASIFVLERRVRAVEVVA